MSTNSSPLRVRRRYVPAVGPRLKKLLIVVLAMFALLSVNAVYLGTITFAEWLSGETYQDYFYQYMFLIHLVVGLLILLPVIIYGIIHIRNAHDRPNRRAVKVGYALFTAALLLLFSGLVLTRGLPLLEIRSPSAREIAYWMHVITPLLVAWLFILHRLAGRKINWRLGGAVAAVAAVFAVGMLVLQAQDPRQWNTEGPASGEQYFFPSLARTATGNFIPAEVLMNDDYCKDCHADTHRKWSHSMHRFASFNNPAYLFSVRNTREFALERDGDVQASRFCAGCHDLVPFFSGAFDDPDFDDVNHPTAQAGITCTGCHAITHVNSRRGNADYTIEEPLHYPFANSESAVGQWVNQTLVKAKPAFHRKTFLKPLHKTPEFCGSCHKVHLPESLNNYKWLRGQNHFDAYELSGVSGHGITSFYYPPKAKHNCNGCHMPDEVSDDFGARLVDGELQIHDHQFASANTGIPHLLSMPAWVNDAQREMLEGSLRVDLFGLRPGGGIEDPLVAPLNADSVPTLRRGETYLIEIVLRTLTLGHLFTQGTADSNEVWVDVMANSGERVVGRSGGMAAEDSQVDPWSHFVNAYVIDREGNRIDRRNPEDIFVPLYNNQIPPGAADVVHYRLTVPEDADDSLTVTAALQYRKFDTTFMRMFEGDAFDGNDLPITTIATDSLTFPIGDAGVQIVDQSDESVDMAKETNRSIESVPTWQRWNDFGIGLLRKGGMGQLRQAEEAFAEVEALGRADGPLNLARVYLREGRLDDAVESLQRAGDHAEPAYPWSIEYFTAQVNAQNGYLDEAIEGYRSLLETRYQEAQDREFDFGKDYRLINEYARTLLERSNLERRGSPEQEALLNEAAESYSRALTYDSENAAAHYGIAQIYSRLGETELEQEHRRLHGIYRVDDNARDRAIVAARAMNPAADHAADAVVVYDLQRPGAPELDLESTDDTMPATPVSVSNKANSSNPAYSTTMEYPNP